jgi:hypothetical protein
MFSFWRGLALTAAIAGALTAGQPTLASAATGPAISITAASGLPAVTHDVYVVYQGGKLSTATVSGAITGAAAGDSAKLYATPFHGPARQVASATLGAAAQSYSFTVTPTVATRYVVSLFQGSTLLASSAARFVYVDMGGRYSGPARCARPVCREKIRIVVSVPPAALADQRGSRWYPYFAVNLGGQRIPSPPRWLYLNGGHAAVSRPVKVAPGRFALTISYSFTVGNHAYYWLWTACTKDIEARDGLGLPGSHGCGAKRVTAAAHYLG